MVHPTTSQLVPAVGGTQYHTVYIFHKATEVFADTVADFLPSE